MKKEYRVSSYEDKDISPEETLVDSLGSSKVEIPISDATLRFAFSLTFILLGIFLIAAFRLQIWQGKSFRQVALGNRSEVYAIPALRGDILDRHGQVLAENKPVFDLIAISVDLPKNTVELDSIITQLGQVLNESVVSLSKIFENRNKSASFVIKKNLKTNYI